MQAVTPLSVCVLPRSAIMNYRRDMGGETALTNNDRFVKHQISIMETRVKNSAVRGGARCQSATGDDAWLV